MSDYRPRMARTWSGPTGPGTTEPSSAERFELIVRANLQNPDFCLGDAARQLHTSERSLQRELQSRGTSFRQELGRARTEAAQELLRSARSTDEIARAVGYRRREHFSRAFHRQSGHTPSSWRSYCRRSRKS